MPPKPRPLPKMSEKKLLSKFGGNTINEINIALEKTSEGAGRGGKGKLVKLVKLQNLGGLTKLPVKPGWRVGKVGRPIKYKGLAESPRARARTPPRRPKHTEIGVPPRGKKPSEGVPPERSAQKAILKMKAHKEREGKALHELHKGGGYGRKDTGIPHEGLGTAHRTDNPSEFVKFKSELTAGTLGHIPMAIPMGDEGFVPVPRGDFPQSTHAQHVVSSVNLKDKKAMRRRKIQRKMKAHGLL